MITRNKLYYYRKYKLEMTQPQVAKKAGMNPTTYFSKERGDKEFTLSEAVKVSSVLGITVEKMHKFLTEFVEVDFE